MESTVSLIGFFIMLIGGLNFLWILLWYVLSLSGQAGAKISKKVGTDNENTDQYIEENKSFNKDLIQKLAVRGIVTFIGALMYFFG